MVAGGLREVAPACAGPRAHGGNPGESMKRVLFALTAGLAALTVGVAPAAAITKNFQPDPDHTFVGLVVFYDAAGEFDHRCTGELIAPTVLLTAGHCISDGAGGVMPSARVWFEQDAGAGVSDATNEDPTTGYPVECLEADYCAASSAMYTDGFDNFAGFPDTHDVGVVILDKAMTNLGFAHLAPAGMLDSLYKARGTQDTSFRVSGYGISRVNQTGTVYVSYRVRLQAVESLVNLNSPYNAGYNIQLNGNGNGRGGTCEGDSGGPVFYPQDTSRIVALTSFGKTLTCRGDGFYYRLDRQEVIDWILSVAGSDADLIAAGIN
jgi:Trypsin